MQIEQIVSFLVEERDRLSRAIEALQGPVKRRGRPPGSGRKQLSSKPPVHHKRTLSAAGRKAIVAAAKKRWALIKAGKAKSPFAAKKGMKAGDGAE
jgi:hypothetical protein